MSLIRYALVPVLPVKVDASVTVVPPPAVKPTVSPVDEG